MDETDADEQVQVTEGAGPTKAVGDDQFLIPGPTSTSNEGALRWGLSWLILSFILMAGVGLMSLVCWWLATITGIA